jgi:predicted nucleic acid-binding protein
VPDFVDSNILVYARDPRDREKHERARTWLSHLSRTRSGRLSTQVLNEYYVTVTRKLAPGVPLDRARAEVRRFFTWRPVGMDEGLLEEAWAVEDRFRLSFWDALIVAGAKATRCERLLTEDLTDGQNLDGVLVTNPFEHPPTDESAS